MFYKYRLIYEGVKMTKYECMKCEYVYNPDEGDKFNDIKSGVPFEGLPSYWVCPKCGAGKNDFEPVFEGY
jgi:rubredoxin